MVSPNFIGLVSIWVSLIGAVLSFYYWTRFRRFPLLRIVFTLNFFSLFGMFISRSGYYLIGLDETSLSMVTLGFLNSVFSLHVSIFTYKIFSHYLDDNG